MLGFSFLSLIGRLLRQGQSSTRWADYLATRTRTSTSTSSYWRPGWRCCSFSSPSLFWVWVLSRGISGGIEKLALIGMPILFVCAFLLLARVLTLPTDGGLTRPTDLNFIWNPDWVRIWLTPGCGWPPQGQMFFTLSVGMGSIQTYASYLRKKDDVDIDRSLDGRHQRVCRGCARWHHRHPGSRGLLRCDGRYRRWPTVAAYDLGVVAMGVVFQGLPGPGDPRTMRPPSSGSSCYSSPESPPV